MVLAKSNLFHIFVVKIQFMCVVGEDVVDKADIEEVEGADTVYEREEHKYVAEEKDFTQPQFFVAEEVSGAKNCDTFRLDL